MHVTDRLMSDVRRGPRGPRRAPTSHDVTCPGLHLDLPAVQVRLAARFCIRGDDVAPYTRLVEKHAAVPVGKFARQRAVLPPAGHDVRWLTFTVPCQCATLVSEL
jgi:hypothetical protein